jgi:3-oxoacyl-[acyl-carrier protein] reductase
VRLQGKAALVTGGGRGIGRAIARKFLEEGARVLIADVAPGRAESAARELLALGEVHGVQADVSRAAEVDALVRRALELWGRVDVLASNAGIARFAPFLEMTESDWDRTMEVNLKGMFLVGQRVAREMVARGGGAIVNMASTNGILGERQLAAYNASKAGVILLTKTMALELAEHGIRVNCVSPGFIDTEITLEAGAGEAFKREYARKIPLRRLGRPEEVASVFAFLASDEASFITGESVVVDGGQISEE